jgi:hypothetical protein
MAFTDTNVTDAEASAALNAKRGIKSLTIGDRRIDYQDTKAQIEAKRMMDNDEQGGIYPVVFPPKGYF